MNPRTGKPEYDPESARRMTFWQHLGELRVRLFRSAFYVLVLACVGWYFKGLLIELLTAPLNAYYADMRLTVLAVQEAFLLYIRIATYSGIAAASPLILLEAWGFVAPALSPRERRLVMPVLPVVLLLFIAGVLFIYFQLVPVSISILLGMAGTEFDLVLTVDKYINFVLGLCMAGGIMFEMPVVLAILGYLELVTSRGLWLRSNIAVVVLLTLSAIITPTGDALTMVLFTLPLLLLYFASTLVVWLIERRNRRKTAESG
ncbi:twin-arginine translocase subunit TatC [bacterium]|nr:twin-arginine translocase subunit TatC [bacterium]